MKTVSKSKTVSVLTTDTELVANNPNRVQLTIQNNGANEIHIDIDNTVSSSSGLVIASGGTLSLNKLEDGDLVTRRWLGAASVATVACRVYEVLKNGEKEE